MSAPESTAGELAAAVRAQLEALAAATGKTATRADAAAVLEHLPYIHRALYDIAVNTRRHLAPAPDVLPMRPPVSDEQAAAHARARAITLEAPGPQAHAPELALDYLEDAARLTMGAINPMHMALAHWRGDADRPDITR